MNKFNRSTLLIVLLTLLTVYSFFSVALAEENLGRWATKQSMTTSRYGLKVVELNGKIYAIGGFETDFLNTVEEYDPATDTWTTKTSMPTGRYLLSLTKVNNKIYAIGGVGGAKSVEEYDSAIDTWTTKASMSTGRNNLFVAEMNNKIYAIGGGASDTPKNLVEEFTLDSLSICNKPTNLKAVAGDKEVGLSWDEVEDADSYIIKRSETEGGPYTIIEEDITGLSYTDRTVDNGTTYYYVVSAVIDSDESDDSNEASATPEGSSSGSGDKAILRITMQNGKINEYDLLMNDVEDFIDWFEDRA
ncbi:kelch repeat-containing protein [Wukongibacter sp. M2B1]|uniref:Kelch repeat-containing protein n=1 Tax=Wukongibacter sp. M2B1 TaxID=3088895 RepID=UPI003D7A0A24